MCWNGKCFDFEDYRNKKVAVLVCGPGFLEYSWALETVLYLKESGAEVSLLDFSSHGSVYSLRLNKFGFHLPTISRKLLRRVLLRKCSRFEVRVEQAALSLGIDFIKFHFRSFRNYFSSIRKVQISVFQDQRWGQFEAKDILISLFSSFDRELLSLDSYVNKGIAVQTREVIEVLDSTLNGLIFDEFDTYFLANGRQPVQAALTTRLREKGKSVLLYEAGGGHIFPTQLQRRISYYFTATSNPVELQEKLVCSGMRASEDVRKQASELLEWLQQRVYPAFGIDFMPRQFSTEEINLSSVGRNIAFFTSSDWETSVLLNNQDFKTSSTTFPNQIAAVRVLLDHLSQDDKLFIRLHPSDPGKISATEDYWFELETDPRVAIIPADSSIDSYKLAELVNFSLVWNSTIGLEIALRGLPVGILGDAAYAPTFGICWLKSAGEIQSWLASPQIVSRQQLLPFGIYFGFGGFPINASGINHSGRNSLLDTEVDIVRKPFGVILSRLIRAIS